MGSTHEFDLEPTRRKLRNWGHWCRSIITMGLGFSKKSLLGQLIDSKGVLIKGTVKDLAPENEYAEVVEQLVNELAQIDFNKAKVLYVHYTLNTNNKEKFEKTNLPRTTYFRYLAEAEEWINERLN